jgi:hypothetical protein
VAVALLVVLAGLSTRLFVWPAEGMPFRVDAIVMLAGPGNRLPVALRLAREKRAPLLVVSEGWRHPRRSGIRRTTRARGPLELHGPGDD